MKKLKEIYSSISKSMENPRIRAIVILGMYSIFFVLIFVMINFGGNIQSDTKTNNTNNNQANKTLNYTNISTEYEYDAQIEINKNDVLSKYQITGNSISKENSEIIKLYNEDTDTYEISTKPIIINDDFLNLSKVISYVNDMDYEYSTKYKDGSQLKNYLVPINIIDNTRNTNEKIEINVYELDNKINKVIIDSTEYDKLRDNAIDKIMYVIQYKSL